MGLIRFSKLAVAIFALVTIAAAFSSTPAAATTYDVNLAFGSDTLQGTITTDGRLGLLGTIDITGFNLTMSAGGNSVALNSGGNTGLIADASLTATASSLAINVPGVPAAVFDVFTPSVSPTAAVIFQPSGLNVIVTFDLASLGIQNVHNVLGDVQIGSVSATPIPNSLSMLAPVLGLIAVLWWRDRRKAGLTLKTA